MAVGLGPAWPQLSPWQPGTGKQRVFAFRWHQGACKSLQMSFVSGLCKQEGAGHGFGAAQLCVCGLDLGRGCPLVSRPGQGCWTAKRLLMLSLFLIHPQPVLPSQKSSSGSAQVVLFMEPILEFQAESGFHSRQHIVPQFPLPQKHVNTFSGALKPLRRARCHVDGSGLAVPVARDSSEQVQAQLGVMEVSLPC